MNEVWVIDDDKSIRWVLDKAFSRAGMDVKCFADGNKVLARLKGACPDIILSDIRMPGIDGLSLLEQIHQQNPQLPVVIMTAHSDLDSALSAYQGGAYEYLPKPFDIDEAVALVKRALTTRANAVQDAQQLDVSATGIIGEAPAMQDVYRAIGRLSGSNITVLINGESGTGKELVAQALHRHSPRAEQTFIALNMAAIPAELMESELFGHEKGAFTGATSMRKGHFELADGGVLFLDEIGDMSPELQSRLLRVLASGEFFRVGGHTPVKVDVRIIAATHKDLAQLVKSGKFREDLYHRLNVIRIHVPALRERRSDIPALVRFFLDRVAKELNVEPKTPVPEVIEALQAMDWPGNVRQLENACRWMTVMASGNEIHLEEIPEELLAHEKTTANDPGSWELLLRSWADGFFGKGQEAILETAMPVFERTLIEVALKHTAGRRQEAAKLLGWGRNTLTRKIKELGID